MITFARAIGAAAIMALAMILTACTGPSVPPTPDWEPINPEVVAFAAACGEWMAVEPERDTPEQKAWVKQLEAKPPPPPELTDFWEDTVAYKRSGTRARYNNKQKAVADLGRRESSVLVAGGCMESVESWGVIPRDRALERLEAGFGQGNDVTHLEYASACVDVDTSAPKALSPKYYVSSHGALVGKVAAPGQSEGLP